MRALRDVAADERGCEVRCPEVHTVEEDVRGGLRERGREAGGGERGERGTAHRCDIGDGAGDGLAGDEVQSVRRWCSAEREEVSPFDELVDGEEELAARWRCHHGAVVSRSDEHLGEGAEEGGAGVDVLEEIGLDHGER